MTFPSTSHHQFLDSFNPSTQLPPLIRSYSAPITDPQFAWRTLTLAPKNLMTPLPSIPNLPAPHEPQSDRKRRFSPNPLYPAPLSHRNEHNMASRMGPRSVKDATRFTSTIPHATSKTAGGSGAAPKASPRIPGESPEQRVRRLRQAHLAAQHAQISKTDKFIDASRRFLDVAHRWTIGGIVIFTAVAGVVSIYSVWDMLRYNRARREEWVEAQKKIEFDELSTARLAYLKGEATEDQILLVEEANREAEARGEKLPPLLPAASHRTHFEEHLQPAFEGKSTAATNDAAAAKSGGKGVMGIFSSMLGREEQGDDVGSSQERLGYESLSEEDDAAGMRESDLVRSIESKARVAWEQEKENQRRGGTLDHLGLETAPVPNKKSWWKFW
ncbi:hypothetical protein FZEAL_800 [Fusarium zealandicum]|uniref:Uncharacterized protein n=1 Tax=Fusarium zealandicum TaxID=1053134 RepID=A0A8H4XPG9_9HYPO|nr:hypothetical protein FZEAL_800 [Fusarium zealandicum]